MANVLHVLIIDDSADDAELVLHELQRCKHEPSFARVDTAEALVAALDRQEWDVILADYTMPKFGGMEALGLVRRRDAETPFIFVSDTIGEDMAVAAMRGGAQDYLRKGNLKRLVPAIERELQDVRVRRDRATAVIERRAAEAANEAKSQFLATLTHELRTPLTAIIGFSELMLRADFDPAELRSFLELQRDAARALLALVNDILDLSKIEAGKLELETVPIDLRSIVAGCAALVAQPARAKGLALRTTVDEAVPRYVLGDPTRLRQIMLNLLTNAVKFTDVGSVELSVEMVEPSPGERRLRVVVTDTGIGIPADRQGRLFREFSQVHDAAAQRLGGSGLGLAICQRLVELIGGKIGMRSTEGRGSVFWFDFSLVEAHPSVETAGTLPADSIPPQRILFAEDSPTIRTLVAAVLETAGHQIEFVENGALAVEAAAAASFDLILMDLHMPVMGGLEATGRIRAAEAGRRRVPIVALTANATSDDLARCMAAGMDVFLAKPIDLDLLLATIGQLGAGPQQVPSGTLPQAAAQPLGLEIAAGTNTLQTQPRSDSSRGHFIAYV